MECDDVRMGSKERRSDAIVPDEELWLVPRQPFIFRDDFFDQQIIKSAQNENLNTLQDKIAFIINQYTREIVINLTKYEYRRNIYVSCVMPNPHKFQFLSPILKKKSTFYFGVYNFCQGSFMISE